MEMDAEQTVVMQIPESEFPISAGGGVGAERRPPGLSGSLPFLIKVAYRRTATTSVNAR